MLIGEKKKEVIKIKQMSIEFLHQGLSEDGKTVKSLQQFKNISYTDNLQNKLEYKFIPIGA